MRHIVGPPVVNCHKNHVFGGNGELSAVMGLDLLQLAIRLRQEGRQELELRQNGLLHRHDVREMTGVVAHVDIPPAWLDFVLPLDPLHSPAGHLVHRQLGATAAIHVDHVVPNRLRTRNYS